MQMPWIPRKTEPASTGRLFFPSLWEGSIKAGDDRSKGQLRAVPAPACSPGQGGGNRAPGRGGEVGKHPSPSVRSQPLTPANAVALGYWWHLLPDLQKEQTPRNFRETKKSLPRGHGGPFCGRAPWLPSLWHLSHVWGFSGPGCSCSLHLTYLELPAWPPTSPLRPGPEAEHLSERWALLACEHLTVAGGGVRGHALVGPSGRPWSHPQTTTEV